MALQTLLNVCQRLPCLRLSIQIRMAQAGQWDEQAGTLLHGALGWAMREAAPRLWLAAYGPLTQGEVRPLTLHPPTLPCQWQAGSQVVFGLSLYGDLSRDLKGVLSALQLMGQRGLGSARVSFQVEQLIQQTPMGQRLLWVATLPAQLLCPHPGGLTDALLGSMALCDDVPVQLAQIQAVSRLHIKEQGKPIRQAPSALLLGRAVCRRLLSLLGEVSSEEQGRLYGLLDGLESLHLCWDQCSQTPLQRYSARQQQQHHIDGLMGSWAYRGQVIHLLPWLVIGEWIQVGTKTSFGYGSIQWQLGALEQHRPIGADAVGATLTHTAHLTAC